MCGQDGFPSYKGHIHLAWVLPLSRQNLFFEALQWGRMFLAEIDGSHKDSVSFGSLKEHMYTKRQSQFSVSIPDISKAVRQPWMVR